MNRSAAGGRSAQQIESAPKRNTTQQGGVSLWSAFGLLCRLPACGGLIQKQGKPGKVFPCKQFVPYGEWKRLHFFRQRLTNRTTARPGGSFAWSDLAFCMEKRRPVGRRFSVLEKLSFVAESVFGVWWTTPEMLTRKMVRDSTGIIAGTICRRLIPPHPARE